MNKNITISTRVDSDLANQVTSLAKMQGISKSTLIYNAIAWQLANAGKKTNNVDIDAIEVSEDAKNVLMVAGGATVGILSYKALKKYLDNGIRSKQQVELMAIAGAVAVVSLGVTLISALSKK